MEHNSYKSNQEKHVFKKRYLYKIKQVQNNEFSHPLCH